MCSVEIWGQQYDSSSISLEQRSQGSNLHSSDRLCGCGSTENETQDEFNKKMNSFCNIAAAASVAVGPTSRFPIHQATRCHRWHGWTPAANGNRRDEHVGGFIISKMTNRSKTLVNPFQSENKSQRGLVRTVWT